MQYPVQDEDRLKQAVNTAPDHATLNAMIARGPEEVCYKFCHLSNSLR